MTKQRYSRIWTTYSLIGFLLCIFGASLAKAEATEPMDLATGVGSHTEQELRVWKAILGNPELSNEDRSQIMRIVQPGPRYPTKRPPLTDQQADFLAKLLGKGDAFRNFPPRDRVWNTPEKLFQLAVYPIYDRGTYIPRTIRPECGELALELTKPEYRKYAFGQALDFALNCDLSSQKDVARAAAFLAKVRNLAWGSVRFPGCWEKDAAACSRAAESATVNAAVRVLSRKRDSRNDFVDVLDGVLDDERTSSEMKAYFVRVLDRNGGGQESREYLRYVIRAEQVGIKNPADSVLDHYRFRTLDEQNKVQLDLLKFVADFNIEKIRRGQGHLQADLSLDGATYRITNANNPHVSIQKVAEALIATDPRLATMNGFDERNAFEELLGKRVISPEQEHALFGILRGAYLRGPAFDTTQAFREVLAADRLRKEYAGAIAVLFDKSHDGCYASGAFTSKPEVFKVLVSNGDARPLLNRLRANQNPSCSGVRLVLENLVKSVEEKAKREREQTQQSPAHSGFDGPVRAGHGLEAAPQKIGN